METLLNQSRRLLRLTSMDYVRPIINQIQEKALVESTPTKAL